MLNTHKYFVIRHDREREGPSISFQEGEMSRCITASSFTVITRGVLGSNFPTMYAQRGRTERSERGGKKIL